MSLTWDSNRGPLWKIKHVRPVLRAVDWSLQIILLKIMSKYIDNHNGVCVINVTLHVIFHILLKWIKPLLRDCCYSCLQSSTSFLQFLDVSVGKEVAAICTKTGRLDVMCQNPHNAIIHLGHHNGTVTLWSPNQKEALVKMLCHQGAVRSVAVDKTGTWVTQKHSSSMTVQEHLLCITCMKHCTCRQMWIESAPAQQYKENG